MSSATSNAPSIAAEQCSTASGAMHATNATDATNERVQDQRRSSSVLDRATGVVDNSRSPIRTVPVGLPEWVWGRLATIAEHREVSVGALVADGVMAVLGVDDGRLGELEMELRKMRVERQLREIKGRAA